MCILFIAIQQHPDYPLIVAANRDEFHRRPSQQAHVWLSDESIIAGKDLQQGGTWLGVNQRGQFAALTNIRDTSAHRDEALSRGNLVVNALTNRLNRASLNANYMNYNPFNLVFSEQDTLWYFHSQSAQFSRLEPGFHAICNGKMDDVWPKMAHGEQALEALINAAKQRAMVPDSEQLFTLLTNKQQAPEHLLPNTGVGLQLEKMLSSIFITSDDYGTRSSCVLLRDKYSKVRFYERTYNRQGAVVGEQQFVTHGQH
ncbi:NRDE family protein [Thalassotalea ponticola]|uniref:NRDE family protein n=1 Tax=Thalassotalea ponticola TaxID=1523392 RepID=UPI0025B50C78|nr:NRDE family protein [Thalassotalea ponticola]MDN3652020.1 NRDE family protein [Thalassotalea ponticola]